MTPERFERVRSLFLSLREAPLQERESRLHEACNGDDALRDTVRSLLDADSSSERSFLDEPVMRVASVFDPPKGDTRETPPPTRIDRYRLVRLLGSGSVGDVYLAEQEHPVSRSVAVKLLRPSVPDSLSDARFRIEREALAKLSHPNIAGILDAGRTPDGRPFLVVEYVDGQRLDDYIGDACPSIEARVELFLQLCAGVQHAHNRGVIHRDLKPANVLVVSSDENPTVKIVDFGIAKLLGDATGLTITSKGQVLGTLAYMSPEQLDPSLGQVDARSDVYALGVILYRLLSGRMPHGETGSAFMHSVCAGGAPDARALTEVPRHMRRDLETVVRKALEREPDRRYASAAQMADDVRRVLDGDPILARRASFPAAAARLARRHPWMSGLLAASLALIVSLAAISTAAVIRLNKQVGQERDTLAVMLDESLERIRRLSGAMEGRRAMADSLLAQTDRLLEIRPRDTTLLECRARILDELSDIALAERDALRSRSLREEVVSITRGLARERPADVELARRHAESVVKLGDLEGGNTNPRGSEASFRHALELHRAHAERWPDHPGVLDDLCWSYERMAAMFFNSDDLATAREYALKSAKIAERLVRRWPERPLSHHAARGAMLSLYITTRAEDQDESWRALDAAARFASESVMLEPDRLDFIYARARVHQNLVEYYLRHGMHEDAESHAHSMHSDADRLVRDNPERREIVDLACRARLLLAETYAAACRRDDLIRTARSGIRAMLSEQSGSPFHATLDASICQMHRLLDRAEQMGAIATTW